MMFFWSPGNDTFVTPVNGENGTWGMEILAFQSYSDYLQSQDIDSDQHGINIAMDNNGTLTFVPPAELGIGTHSLEYTNVTDIWGTRGSDTITGDEFQNYLNPGDGGDNILTGGSDRITFQFIPTLGNTMVMALRLQ